MSAALLAEPVVFYAGDIVVDGRGTRGPIRVLQLMVEAQSPHASSWVIGKKRARGVAVTLRARYRGSDTEHTFNAFVRAPVASREDDADWLRLREGRVSARLHFMRQGSENVNVHLSAKANERLQVYLDAWEEQFSVEDLP